LHVALADLIDAIEEGRIESAQARDIWQGLWNDLRAAGLRDDELARLQYSNAARPT
jgi:hypothetical protein